MAWARGAIPVFLAKDHFLGVAGIELNAVDLVVLNHELPGVAAHAKRRRPFVNRHIIQVHLLRIPFVFIIGPFTCTLASLTVWVLIALRLHFSENQLLLELQLVISEILVVFVSHGGLSIGLIQRQIVQSALIVLIV